MHSHPLSLRRRSSWPSLTGFRCVDGIPHGCRPCAAVLGHLDADPWPLPVPTSKAIDPGSSWMVLDQVFRCLPPAIPPGRQWSWANDLSGGVPNPAKASLGATRKEERAEAAALMGYDHNGCLEVCTRSSRCQGPRVIEVFNMNRPGLTAKD